MAALRPPGGQALKNKGATSAGDAAAATVSHQPVPVLYPESSRPSLPTHSLARATPMGSRRHPSTNVGRHRCRHHRRVCLSRNSGMSLSSAGGRRHRSTRVALLPFAGARPARTRPESRAACTPHSANGGAEPGKDRTCRRRETNGPPTLRARRHWRGVSVRADSSGARLAATILAGARTTVCCFFRRSGDIHSVAGNARPRSVYQSRERSAKGLEPPRRRRRRGWENHLLLSVDRIRARARRAGKW